jgi:hypothetical protein
VCTHKINEIIKGCPEVISTVEAAAGLDQTGFQGFSRNRGRNGACTCRRVSPSFVPQRARNGLCM